MGCCSNSSNKTITLNVEGMSCNHCKMAVEKALNNLGVDKADVDLEGKKVTVTFDPNKTSENDIKNAINNEGYTVQ